MPRAPLTLLWITRQSLVRADFARGSPPALIEQWEQPRPELDDPASLIEAAIAQGPKVGRKVWVLWDELWAQTMTLPAQATAKLAGDELHRALAFEAEPLSGLGALESVVGAVELSATREDRTYWLAQAPAAEREQIEDAILRAGGKPAGLVHPGGLPIPLAVDESSWERVELWPNLVCCLHGEPGQPVQSLLINADPEHGRWKIEEQKWRERLAEVQRREVLLTTAELMTFTGKGEPLDTLPPAKLLPIWLTAWAKLLETQPRRVPVIRPAVRPMTPATRALVAAGIGLGTALVCAVFHFIFWLFLVTPSQVELARLNPAVQQVESLTRQQPLLEKQKTELAKQNDTLGQTSDLVAVQRQRLAKLLDALAKHQPEHLWVQKIEGAPGLPLIRGVCLEEGSANELATRLSSALPAEWQVQPPRLKAMDKLTGRGPWSFELQVKIVTPPGVVATPVPPNRSYGGD